MGVPNIRAMGRHTAAVRLLQAGVDRAGTSPSRPHRYTWTPTSPPRNVRSPAPHPWVPSTAVSGPPTPYWSGRCHAKHARPSLVFRRASRCFFLSPAAEISRLANGPTFAKMVHACRSSSPFRCAEVAMTTSSGSWAWRMTSRNARPPRRNSMLMFTGYGRDGVLCPRQG